MLSTLAGYRHASHIATPIAPVVRTSVQRLPPLPTVSRRARVYLGTGERRGSETETSMTQTIAYEHPDAAPLTAMFVDALKQTTRIRSDSPAWRRKDMDNTDSDDDLRCTYCGRGIAMRHRMTAGRRPACASRIIPVSAGGCASEYINVVPCCTDCQKSKGRRDLLEWKPDIDEELQARRLQVLHASLNHVVPLTARTAAGAEAVLRKRWQQPRFRALGNVFMQYGFFAWHTGSLPSALGDGLVFVLRRTFVSARESP